MPDKHSNKLNRDQPDSWSTRAERGSVLGLRLMILVIRLLGERVCICLLYPITFYFMLTGISARRASYGYLQKIWRRGSGAYPITSHPGYMHVYRHFLEFGRAIIDRFQLWLGRSECFNVSWHGEGRKVFLNILESGRGAILLSAHLGNLEVLRALSLEKPGIVINALMYTRHSQRVNSLLKELNPSAGLRAVALENISIDTIFSLQDRLARGEFVTMLADRVSAGAPGRNCAVSFLGDMALLPQGPYVLSSLLRAPIYTIFALRTGMRSYRIYFELFAERVEIPQRSKEVALTEYAERFAARLEEFCLMDPYQWFNFYNFWGTVHLDRREEQPPSERIISNGA